MSKILFDIAAAHEAVDRKNCHLVMEISRHIFSYAIINQQKKLLQLRLYELDVDNNSLVNELAEIIGADEILHTDTGKKMLLYNFPGSQLVPEEYFHINTNNELIELLHGDLVTGMTRCEKIKGLNQYNVFRLPGKLHDLLQERFPDAEHRHYYSLWLECEKKQPSGNDSYLSVVFYPHRILVSAVKNKQLHLLQSYDYEAAEDVAYYLLNICGQLQLAPENTPVKFAGMIDLASVLYTEIFKYFGELVPQAIPDMGDIPALLEFPPHFFSPLLKMAICVS